MATNELLEENDFLGIKTLYDEFAQLSVTHRRRPASPDSPFPATNLQHPHPIADYSSISSWYSKPFLVKILSRYEFFDAI